MRNRFALIIPGIADLDEYIFAKGWLIVMECDVLKTVYPLKKRPPMVVPEG